MMYHISGIKRYVIFSIRLVIQKHYILSMISLSSKSLLKKILLPFFIASVFLLLLLSPLLYYSFSPSLYVQQMKQSDITLSGQSINYVQNVYSFIQWKSSLDPIFSSAEKNHMQDVKQLFHMVVVSEIIACMVFFLSLLIFVLQRKISFIIRWFLRGSLSSFVFFLLLFLAIRINFQITFDIFHRLFFPQGNRSFGPSCVLVSLFPLSFFEAITTRIFVVSTVISLVVFVLDDLEKIYWKNDIHKRFK